MSKSLKKNAVNGLFWSGAEKFAYEAVQFVVSIVLARLLTPHDYGLVGLITVFITISQLFVDGKMTTALIQKKNRTDIDFHTVFFFNLAVSVFLYLLLFVSSPLVAKAYEIEELSSLLRLLALVLIISPFASIQITQLTIALDFRKISYISIPSALMSGAIGIYMAYKGYGPYAIVGQQISMVVMRGLLANLLSTYRIKPLFSKDSFRDLFSFSYKLVISSSLDRIYRAIYTMVIGKVFNPTTLGLYTRGNQFPSMTANILGDIFNRVTLPVMSTVQDETDKLKHVFRKYIIGSSFVIFPALICLVVVAKPLVLILLTYKWIESVPIVQLMCFAFMTRHISSINRNLLYAKKRADLALKLELFKKSLAFAIFFASLYFGIIGVCWGQVIYGFIASFLNSFYTKRFIGVGIWQQTMDYSKVLFVAIIAAIIPYLTIDSFLTSTIAQLFYGLFSYCAIYLLINAVFRTYSFVEAKAIMSEYIKKIKKQ